MTQTQWYRITKDTGDVFPISHKWTLMAARGAYRDAPMAMAAGRFSTAFSIYSTDAQLSDDERSRIVEVIVEVR